LITHAAGTAKVFVPGQNQWQQRCWHAGRFYEPQLLRWIWQNVDCSGKTIVDVGSSIGNHTLFFAKFLDPSLVLSIEPYKPSMDLQREVLALNGMDDKVTLLDVALSDAVGRGQMKRFGPEHNDGMVWLKPGDEVEVTTLDALAESYDLSNTALVKVDVEYHEINVLRGAAKFLRECRPEYLFIELTDPVNLLEGTKLLGYFGYDRIGRYANVYYFQQVDDRSD
jgi:FkbM family methyltransferase